MNESNLARIEYYGYLSAASGLGVAARGYLKALKKTQLDLVCFDLTPPGRRKVPPPFFSPSPANTPKKIIRILHVNADELPRILRITPAENSAHVYQIGIWAWETEHFPEEWRDRFALIDEIWVSSSFMARSISSASSVPVIVIPYAIDIPEYLSNCDQIKNRPFIFFFSFDYLSIPERKNPLAIIQAYKKAFNAHENVILRIKSMHKDNYPDYAHQLNKAAQSKNIELIDASLSINENWNMLNDSDVYISLHRSEGFGLGMAEAMALGKPVIATAYGGNCDFMNQKNSALVGFHLKATDRAYPPYPIGTIWAEPDIDNAARLMRRLFSDSIWKEKIRHNAYNHMKQYYTPTSIATNIVNRLEHLNKLNYQRNRKISREPMHNTNRLIWKLMRSCWYIMLIIIPDHLHQRLYRLRRFLI